MSTNRPTTGKDPKKPQELMVTRTKSAQMKRQLRVKDRSMKHLTDLLKSPTKESQSASRTVPVKKKASPKAKQSLLKSVEKIQNLPQKTFKLSKVLRKEILLAQNEEYYPNKRKRKLTVNKVVLKPKTTSEVVGELTGSVKRKYAVPVKAMDKSAIQPKSSSTVPAKLKSESVKLSMAEAIQIMDEQLTDEDLMEILTCPSPVWWEDPPDDEEYIEDSLFTRSPPASKKKDAAPASPVPMEVDEHIAVSDAEKIIPIPNLSARSDKFLKKRSKLEDLLGNIKDKNTKQNGGKVTKTSSAKVIVMSANTTADVINEAVAENTDTFDAKPSTTDENNKSNKDEAIANDIDSLEAILSESDDNNEFNSVMVETCGKLDGQPSEPDENDEIDKLTAKNNNKFEAELSESDDNNEINNVMANTCGTLDGKLSAPDEIDKLTAKNNNKFEAELSESDDNNEINNVMANTCGTLDGKLSEPDEIDKLTAKNNNKLEAKLSESDDEIVLHNSSMNEDELLKDLENMDIPIANVIVIDDDEDFLDKTSEGTVSESKNECTKAGSDINKEVSEYTDNTISEEVEATKNLPALVKYCTCDDIASPKSSDSLSSKSSSQSSMTSSFGKDVDTISDTNVRFLLEDEVEDSKNKMASQINADGTNKCNNNESTESDKEPVDENVTVYKIIEEISETSAEIPKNDPNEKDIHSIVDAKLNDYFKKCKKVFQKRGKKEERTDINKNETSKREIDNYLTISCDTCKPTFKKVSENENVKYCLKCSAIFDSKDCMYCIKKTDRTCVACKIRFCCTTYYKTHTINCCKLRNITADGNDCGVPQKMELPFPVSEKHHNTILFELSCEFISRQE